MPAGHHVLTDAVVIIDGVDLSSDVESVGLDYFAEPQDVTTMGQGTRIRLGGLLDWSMSITFKQNYSASRVDATLFPIVGTVVTVAVLPADEDGATPDADDPEYTGSGLIERYNPLGQTVGEAAGASCEITSSGTLARNTS